MIAQILTSDRHASHWLGRAPGDSSIVRFPLRDVDAEVDTHGHNIEGTTASAWDVYRSPLGAQRAVPVRQQWTIAKVRVGVERVRRDGQKVVAVAHGYIAAPPGHPLPLGAIVLD